MIALIAELLTKLDGLAMITGQRGLAQAWDPWIALRDELKIRSGYPSIEEYEAAIKSRIVNELVEALS